ncbi:hypothetical protein SAMN05443668_1024 [Cryptosporangium aurantiacum]|uniref:EVE domain-containing protein n=1 Tax=Cryptosporangium aurantiacum TaxID=134849 RepID=A0A1M7M8E4_9ACTN|nr:hypothetical protein SAMN05443668_1024 [Cryptosporangium aurantiacum]
MTTENLGAWVLKGNADHVDLAGRFAVAPGVDQWCVRAGYRARLMQAGQPVVFWASGRRAGVWGIGRLTGPAEAHVDGGLHVPLDLTIAPEPLRVPRAALRDDPRLADTEVFRQPQASNPSFLTVEQFDAVLSYWTQMGLHARRG